MRTQVDARAFLLRLRNALIAAVVCTVVAIGGAYFVAARKVAQVPKVNIDTSVLEPGGNYLLVGSDSRSFVATPQDAQRFGSKTQSGQRSDTIMVAHIDGGKGTGFLVSFPRDLWVDIPRIGHAKINAAFNAGPQRLIETIEQDFDVPISHYLEVDFSGFRKIVDAIGAIPISFPAPARDRVQRPLHQPSGMPAPVGARRARVRAVAVLRDLRERTLGARPDIGSRTDQASAILLANTRATSTAHG